LVFLKGGAGRTHSAGVRGLSLTDGNPQPLLRAPYHCCGVIRQTAAMPAHIAASIENRILRTMCLGNKKRCGR